MSIATYQKKRDFKRTKEPQPHDKGSAAKLKFVVQRHHASHLHYDLRLEINGVLKSWAVPKGPSLNPQDKRLAMMVEDHPYSYKDFEGAIPKGNYGAGTVYIFDSGDYQSLAKRRKDDEQTLADGLKNGNLKFRLKGKILKGEFALVRLKNAEQNAWLLIKHKDEYAAFGKFDVEKLIPEKVKKEGKGFKKIKKKAVELPVQKGETSTTNYQPMLASLSKHVFDDDHWLYERKWDGYRILAFIQNGKVKLISRNGKDYTDKYDSIINDLENIKENTVLDGELVAFDKKGKESFQLLQHEEDRQKANLIYYVFDMLELNGHELIDMTLQQRKELLQTMMAPYQFKNTEVNHYVVAKGKQLYSEAYKKGWEGIIAKNMEDTYYPGKRSATWLKFKFNNSEEAVICGYTAPEGNRKYFGALVLGKYNEDQQLVYIGNCGTGFSDSDLKNLFQLFQKDIIKRKPFTDKVAKESSVTWVKPQIICEVKFTEWTKDKHLRHPVFKGVREDKNNSDLLNDVGHESAKTSEILKEELKLNGKKITLSNLDKIFWSQEKITKGELISYYMDVAPFILPYLKDKPLSLNRHPNGINKKGFYQKNIDTDNVPKWLKTAQMHSESTNKIIDYLICNNEATLVYMANLGCIEINPWLSTYKNPNNPDYMVIDLDPDKNSFEEVIEVALSVKQVYDQMGIDSYIKTSGSSGMHIFVYVGGQYTYDFIKDFSRFIAQKVHELKPNISSVERALSKRKGKIYIDFLQNRRGQTIAAPYSVRPKIHATVSFPLSWDDLDKPINIADYHIKNVPQLLNQQSNPWENIHRRKQDLKAALQKIKD